MRQSTYRRVFPSLLEVLEQRRLLAGDLVSDPVESLRDKQVHPSELIARVPENLQEFVPQSFHEATHATMRPVVSAGSPTGTPPDSPENRIDPNVGGRFGGVVSIEAFRTDGNGAICSGVVVAPTFVLSAGHCFDLEEPLDGIVDPGLTATIHINNGGDQTSSHEAANFFIHPDFQGAPNGGESDDITVVELATPVPPGTPIYPISSTGLQLGDRIEFVGYGVSGTGETGYTINPTLVDKRVGQNRITLVFMDDEGVSPLNEVFLFDFDEDNGDPGWEPPAGASDVSLGNDLESSVGPGDSGGPVFVEVDGEPVLAGLITFQLALSNITAPPGFFGSLAGGLIAEPYVPFINSFIGVDLQVEVTESQDPSPLGGTFTHEVTVTNAGPNTATNVTLEEMITVPPGVTASVTTSSGTYTAPNWSIPSIASGATETMTISFTVGGNVVGGADIISSTATITGVTEPDTDPNNDSHTIATSVPFVDIAISQTETVDPVGFGGGFVYTVTAENLGTLTATGVTVGEALTLPSGVFFDQAIPSNGTSFTDGIWNIGNLGPGEAAELALVLSVTTAASEGVDQIESNATLRTVNELDIDPSNDSLIERTSIEDRGIDLAVTQASQPISVVRGSGEGNLELVVTVENLGNVAAASAIVDNTLLLPAGVTIESVEASSGAVLGNTGWILNEVGAETAHTLTYLLTVDSTAPVGTDLISNTASISFIGGIDRNDDNNTSTVQASIESGVDIGITIAESVDPVITGSGLENLAYTITATNNGVFGATNVTVDTALSLPAGTTVSRVVPSSGTYADPNWSIASLPVGGSETLTVFLTVNEFTAEGTDVISATASLVGQDGVDNVAANDAATVSTSTTRPAVDIALEFTESDDPVIAGLSVGSFTYTLTATNNGPNPATNVVVGTDLSLPAGIIPDDITPSSGEATFSEWTIPTLAAGASETLTFDFTVLRAAVPGADVIRATASLTGSDQADADAGNNTANVSSSIGEPFTPEGPYVDISLFHPPTGSVEAGSGFENLTYTIIATNQGNLAATNVEIDALLDFPEGVRVSSLAGASIGSFADGRWSIPTLDAGFSATLNLRLTVPEAVTPGANLISASSTLVSLTEEDLDPTNDTFTNRTSIDPPAEPFVPDLDIALNVIESLDPVQAGSGEGNLVYTIEATNQGLQDAIGVSVQPVITLPTGVTLDSIVPSSGVYNGAIWNIISLPAGTTETLTLTLTVSVGANAGSDVLSASGLLTGLVGLDEDSSNDTATVMTSINPFGVGPSDPEVDIAITATESADPVIAGSGVANLVYNITATNNGPAAATNVVVDTDVTLPSGVSLDSAIASSGAFSGNSWIVGTLISGQSETLTLTLTADSSVSAGSNVVSALASLTNVVQVETDASNNSASVSTTISPPSIPPTTSTDFDVSIRGSSWVVPSHALELGANATLPWKGMDTIEVSFDSEAATQPTLFLLGPNATGPLIPTALSSFDGSTATFTVPELGDGYYQLLVNGETINFSVLRADHSRNGSVGFEDFTAFANFFGQSFTNLQTIDFDGNGTVGFSDFTLLANVFGANLDQFVAPVPPQAEVSLQVIDQAFANGIDGEDEDEEDKLLGSLIT